MKLAVNEIATDPVYGMAVDKKSAAGTFLHDGKTYHFCSHRCLEKFQARPSDFLRKENGGITGARQHSQSGKLSHELHPHAAVTATAEHGKAKDPICGMVVDKATALKSDRNGRVYYFCSTACQRTFESPEQELKARKAPA